MPHPADIADFMSFWAAHFPEQATLDRDAALADIGEATNGQLSRRPDAEMAPYQDRVAAVYGAYEMAHFQQYTIEHLLDRLQLPTATLTSLGCGPASYELWLLWQARVERVTLIDHSPAMLARAKELADHLGIADRVTTLCRDASNTGLRPASADIVLCINAMHWSANWRNWVKEAWRLSRKRGRVFISASLGLPRSNITAEAFGQTMRQHFKDVGAGMIVPPLDAGNGMATLSSRCYATGRRP